MREKHIGKIEHYYPKAHAATVSLDDRGIKVGDRVHIIGHGTDVTETVESLQIDHEPIKKGRKGQSVGLAVDAPVHAKADVYLVK